MPLRKIEQTSKTLLIEEFCTSDNKPDLYTMLRNEDVKQKSEFNSLIEEKLEVRSFEEFVIKFMPSVWEWTEQTGDPTCPVRFCYSLGKPKDGVKAHEMELSKNEFYNMVMELYSRKGMSGDSNLEFNYSMVAELLAPRKVMENAKQLRKDLQYNYDKMIGLGESAKTEINECKKKIVEIRKEIVSQYRDSFTGRLKLALADTEDKLAALPDNKTQEGNGDSIESESVKALPCRAYFDEYGDIQVIPIEDNSVESSSEKGETSQNQLAQLACWISNDYDKYGDSEEYVRELVISNYCGSPAVRLDRTELLKKRDEYTTIYKYSQEQFIRAISSAVEKMLDVKVFFEQASIAGRKLPAPVIVTNCKASKLMEEKDGVKEKFEYYISECGKEIDRYRIWFAIVPAIGDADFVDKVDGDLVDLDDVDLFGESMDSTVKTKDGDVMVSVESLKQILGVLEKGKITTFFNYRANEKTGFARFSVDILEKYRKKLESTNGNSYAVFCYPNFTVLPKKKTAIEIGKTGTAELERREFLDIPGIYVDSAYVAAGLVVASQNPEYLEKKGYKVNIFNPCVRFDLEDGDNRFKMLTKMNREGKGAWDTEVEDNIGKDKFGFCFCGNTKYFEDKRVKNTYVYVARNMHKDKSGVYDPIYSRLTMDFVMQYLQTENISVGGSNKFKASVVKGFLDEKVAQWKRDAESETAQKNANNILKIKEDVKYEENRLKMIFKETEEEFQLDIEKDE